MNATHSTNVLSMKSTSPVSTTPVSLFPGKVSTPATLLLRVFPTTNILPVKTARVWKRSEMQTTAAPSLPTTVLLQAPISPAWTAAARSYRATHPTNAPATANAAISTASTTPAPLCPAEASTRATIPPPASQINRTQSAKIVRAYKNLEIWTTVALSIPITVLISKFLYALTIFADCVPLIWDAVCENSACVQKLGNLDNGCTNFQ